MNKQYRMSLLMGSLLFFVTLSVMSQENQAFTWQGDSLKYHSAVPGHLFSTDRITNTGAVSTVSGDVMYKTPAPNTTNTVSGRLAGLFSVQGNGTPGSDGASWFIRGLGSYSFSGQPNTAKYFVDGFEVHREYIQNLLPSEIGSLSILKDAAALATFGMKGANGVVWIETERGKLGAPTVRFQSRTGIQQPINILKPLNSFDYASLYNQAISNDLGRVWSPVYSDTELVRYVRGIGTDVDWYDEVMRDQGSYSDVDFSFYGGNNTLRYHVVLGHANQQGLFDVKNTDQTSNVRFSRYNMRTNLDINLFSFLQASIDIGGRLEDRSRPTYFTAALMNDLARYPSNIYPVYDVLAEDDLYNFSGTQIHRNNPVGSATGLGWRSDRMRILQGNFKFRENLDFITKGLYLQEAFSFYVMSAGGISKSRNYARFYEGEKTTPDESTSIIASQLSADRMDQWLQGTITLGYGNNFGEHEVNSAVNYHISEYSGDDEIFGYKYRYLNLNGKVNYVYNRRYVAAFGFSYFGSDAYAPGNRFGFYPALSAAWIASNESFLESSNWLNFMKIRASVGKTGGLDSEESNQMSSFSSHGRYLYQQYYSSSLVGTFLQGTGSSFSGTSTLAPLFIANEEAFAEQSIKYNAGIDLNLFRKIDVNFDMFLDKRSGILTLDNSMMNYYGFNRQFNNMGKMTSKGFEWSAAYSDKAGKLNYSLYGMASYATNTIDYMAEVATAYPYNARTGRALNAVIGLEAIGFYQLSDFNADGSLKDGIPEPMFGSVQPGDIRYRDRNEDGFIDQTDVDMIGNPWYPKWSFGFGGDLAYKGIDFSFLFTGSAGGTRSLLSYSSQMMAFVNNGNAYEWAKNAWAYYPEEGIDTRQGATYPRLTTVENENNYRASSFWMRKNDFLRLKTVELGYDFCHQIIKDSGVSKLRLYVNAMNPITISNLLKNFNMDPESGYGYPALKSYNVGIQLTF
jgi:TonB-linked SusC/RagA family outer membrane protein